MMELCLFGHELKVTMDTLIALVALVVSAVSLGASVRFWRKSFRPIVTATVKTHAAGNESITYDLVLLNSGTIPAKNITVKADDASLTLAFGGDATPENRRRWLACFAEEMVIPILHNGDRVSCSFGMTMGNDMGFWKYKASIAIVINYSGWFGLGYKQLQELRIVDSDSFTGFMWAKSDA
jgi:hypothetical protein